MKRLLLILIISLSFQSLVMADDIRDFQIEGMSIGDSLLDYYSENELEKDFFYNSKKWASISKADSNFETYGGFQAHVKGDDEKYIIDSIEGMILYKDNIEQCHLKQKEISLELDELLKNSKKDEWEKVHSADKDSTTKAITYELDNGDEIGIYCYDWSVNNKYNFIDKLGVLIKSKEFNNWLNNEAYK